MKKIFAETYNRTGTILRDNVVGYRGLSRIPVCCALVQIDDPLDKQPTLIEYKEMTKRELARLDKQLAHWKATDKEHKAYQAAHPQKPLTKTELKWLNWYQNMTHNFKG